MDTTSTATSAGPHRQLQLHASELRLAFRREGILSASPFTGELLHNALVSLSSSSINCAKTAEAQTPIRTSFEETSYTVAVPKERGN